MKKLLLSIIFCGCYLIGNAQNIVRQYQGSGAPSGGCANNTQYIDYTHALLYYCNNGAWGAITNTQSLFSILDMLGNSGGSSGTSMNYNNNGFNVGVSAYYGFSATTASAGTDTGISRNGASGTVAIGNGTINNASGILQLSAINSPTVTGTNVQAADVTYGTGLGTGNAIAAHVILKDPSFSQTSGATAQTLITRYITLKSTGSTTSATATNIFSVAATGVPAAGGVVYVHVYTTQAAPHACSDMGIWEYSVQNDTAVSVSVQRVDATASTICDTGTLTLTAAMSAANPSVFSVTPTWTTIVPTNVWIEVIVENPSDVTITPISD